MWIPIFVTQEAMQENAIIGTPNYVLPIPDESNSVEVLCSTC